MSKLIRHKHLTTGETILGYGWPHFKKMYNLSSERNGVNDIIDDTCRGFLEHKAYRSSKKKEKQQDTITTKNTVSEIKEWLSKKGIPFPANGKKDMLLSLVKSRSKGE